MRRYCLTLYALIPVFVLLLQVGCQEQTKGPQANLVSPAVETGAAITFEKVVHDFGEVASGKRYPAEFKFTNTGDGPLKILEIKQCCGVVAKLDRREFAPGESGVLKVEFVSGPNSSVMRRMIYVSSNDNENPRIELTLSAKVVPKVACEPQRITLMLNKDNAGCPNITLTALDNQPFSIKTFTSTGNSITADVDRSVEATSFVLQPKVDLDKLRKHSSGFIGIDLTHPERGRILLAFSTRLRFEFTPPTVILFNPEPQKPTIKKITLVNNYGEEFEVTSTSSENGIVKVLSQEKTDKGYQLEVEVTPPARDETGRFTDVLYLHLDDGEKLSIKCYGRYADFEK